jgi:2-polyprenyl-6-methoxyphenol hydroxylase-like FAD-dependent oxidoreductase
MGGVGINLAVQDAVGAAILLAEPLRRRTVTGADLAAVRRRRMPAAALTQGVQRLLHRRVVVPVFDGADGKPPAAFVQLLKRLPWLTVIPARVIGVGVRPERAPAFARR